MPAELELRRAVALAPRGGAAGRRADVVLLPASEASAALAFARARELVGERRGGITLAGAERSLEAHFLPQSGAGPNAVVSSKRLRGRVEVLGTSPSEDGAMLRVRALAGTSFGELCRAVQATGAEFMPFSAPTAEAISLGGALAVNAHARASSTHGGLFAKHVRSFRLVDPSGRVHECRSDADGELERELYRSVPGALGSLGLVTELELELRPVSPRAEVVVEVLERSVGDPAPAVRSYLARVADERRDGFRRWSEGLGLVFLGVPGRGACVVLGRRLGGRVEPRRSTLPLFRESAESNLFVQAFSHRYPGIARSLAAQLLRPGRSFRAPYYRWTFFQTSYDECAARVERRKPVHFELFGLGDGFGLVHQAWVVASSALAAFVALAAEVFARPEYEPVADALELLDALPLPAPTTPLEPSRCVGGDAHVVTANVAVRTPSERELAVALCRELSERAHEGGLPVVVQLNKQHHVAEAVLRTMHRAALDDLERVRARVDGDGVLGSETLQRLGI
ncbi:MAG TPA: FAD-binding protein [Polyangiaceae bacterium]